MARSQHAPCASLLAPAPVPSLQLSRLPAALPPPLARCPSPSRAQYTGPVSSPEYLSHLPKASDYRRFAPS